MKIQMLPQAWVACINIPELLADQLKLVHFRLALHLAQVIMFVPQVRRFRLRIQVRGHFCPELCTQSRCALLLDTIHSARMTSKDLVINVRIYEVV